MTLSELAERLGCDLEGDGDIDVTGIAGLDEAGPGDLTFLANPRYASRLPHTRAAAVLAAPGIATAPCAVLRTPEPYLLFARAVSLLVPPPSAVPGISPLAAVDPSAEIGSGVAVAPFAVVGAGARVGRGTEIRAHAVVGPCAVIGDDCLLHAHVSIREGAVLGNRVVIQDGAVIGSDGFGFAHRADGSHEKIPQVGRVVVEDDVEIGAQSAIDRPAVGETRIGRGTKIDNFVQVAHGVKVGRNALLAAQVGIAGSTVVGDDVMMAGQSGATGHVTIGSGARVGAKSAVTKNVRAGRHVVGIPAVDAARWRESVALIRRLPGLRRAVAALEARLDALEKRKL